MPRPRMLAAERDDDIRVLPGGFNGLFPKVKDPSVAEDKGGLGKLAGQDREMRRQGIEG